MIPLILTALLAAQDFKGELEKLTKEYDQARLAFYESLKKAKTDEERDKLIEKGGPDRAYLPKFQDLAKRARGTDAAPPALAKAFELASEEDQAKVQDGILKEMIASHLDSPFLVEMMENLPGLDEEGILASVRTILAKSGNKEVRAAAALALATGLLADSKSGEKEKAEARKLLEGLAKDGAGTPAGKRAAGQLFELDHLQIGMTAPDFEATDTDGKTFKLSDYRGKVVVLDFWGFW